ncbi:flagellar basal body-associated FliL family protein [Marinobacter sp. OP 3.4]|uniref:flagellar basal body-associated FliL family protein n=1 Tax=Marinobacter sp. OP 3.4 TaxID=3076501 RepID=UPI002E1BFBC0
MMNRPFALWATLLLTCALSFPALAADEPAEGEDEAATGSFTEYVEMTPPFVTHVGEPTESPAYLKAEVSLRVGTETAREAIETHMPRLRHELVILFGEQTDLDTLASTEGQQAVRQEALTRLNQVLADQQTGEEIVDVLFTSFVVQRR